MQIWILVFFMLDTRAADTNKSEDKCAMWYQKNIGKWKQRTIY